MLVSMLARTTVLVAFVGVLVTPARSQSSAAPAPPPVHADLLLRGGTVLDGTGGPGVRADLAVRGDRIVFLGDAGESVAATRTIDVSGLIVAPGGVDPHAHVTADLSDPERALNAPYLMQGVTTVITGNDGQGTPDVAALLTLWEHNGLGTNAGTLVGQGAVRQRVMGMADAAPTPEQLEQMRALVRRAMQEGALGLSSGLFYAPGSFASTEEVIALAKEAGAAGGVYDTHIRDESSYDDGLLAAIAEAIRIGKESGARLNLSHIKALGVDVWGQSAQVIALVEKTQQDGQLITADQYPYRASGTSVAAALLPRWAEAGGDAAMRGRLADPTTRAKIETEMTENLRRRGGADSLLLTGGDDAVRGKTLARVATDRSQPAVQVAIDLILAGDAPVASFNMNEDDIRAFMQRPWVATGSDGCEGHPRKYGTFPRKLRVYALDEHVISLPFAVRAGAAIEARQLRLQDRGELHEGWYADVIAFDPKTVRAEATFEHPERFATGMRYVLVNGQLAVDDGKRTGVRAGRVLRGGSR